MQSNKIHVALALTFKCFKLKPEINIMQSKTLVKKKKSTQRSRNAVGEQNLTWGLALPLTCYKVSTGDPPSQPYV